MSIKVLTTKQKTRCVHQCPHCHCRWVHVAGTPCRLPRGASCQVDGCPAIANEWVSDSLKTAQK